jgi:hypothetical protein
MTEPTDDTDQTAAAPTEGERAAPRALVWSFRASVLVAVAPILVSAVRNGLRHWVAAADPGVTVVRINDVMSSHPPLIGLASSASNWVGRPVSFIGALQLYALAVPVHVLGNTWGVLLGVATINSLMVVAAAWLVRRRAGYAGGLVACAFLAALLWAVGSQVLVDVTPMQIGVVPFATLLVAAWATADGDPPAVFILVVVGDYLFLDHLTFTLSVPLVVAFAFLARWLRLRGLRRAAPNPGALLRTHRRWMAAAVAFTVLAWIPPLYQQFAYRNGNLGNLEYASHVSRPPEPTYLQAGSAVVATVAVPPLWLRPTFRRPTFHPNGSGVPGVVAIGCGLAVLAATLALLHAAWRRRDLTTVTVLLTALVGVLAIFLTTKNQPNPFGVGIIATYIRALWPTAMFVWLALAIAVLRQWPAVRTWGRGLATGLAAGGVTVALSAATLPTAEFRSGAPLWMTPMGRQLQTQVARELRGSGPVLTAWGGGPAATAQYPVVLLELQKMGVAFRVQPAGQVQQYGAARGFDKRHVNAVSTLIITTSPTAPPGYHQIASASSPGAISPAEFAALDRQVRAWSRRLTHLSVNPALVASPIERAVVGAVAKNLLEQTRRTHGDLTDRRAFAELIDTPHLGVPAIATPGIDSGVVKAWAHAMRTEGDQRVYVYLAPISVVVHPPAR